VVTSIPVSDLFCATTTPLHIAPGSAYGAAYLLLPCLAHPFLLYELAQRICRSSFLDDIQEGALYYYRRWVDPRGTTTRKALLFVSCLYHIFYVLDAFDNLYGRVLPASAVTFFCALREPVINLRSTVRNGRWTSPLPGAFAFVARALLRRRHFVCGACWRRAGTAPTVRHLFPVGVACSCCFFWNDDLLLPSSLWRVCEVDVDVSHLLRWLVAAVKRRLVGVPACGALQGCVSALFWRAFFFCIILAMA